MLLTAVNFDRIFPVIQRGEIKDLVKIDVLIVVIPNKSVAVDNGNIEPPSFVISYPQSELVFYGIQSGNPGTEAID